MTGTPRAVEGQARQCALFHAPDSPASRPHSHSDGGLIGAARIGHRRVPTFKSSFGEEVLKEIVRRLPDNRIRRDVRKLLDNIDVRGAVHIRRRGECGIEFGPAHHDHRGRALLGKEVPALASGSDWKMCESNRRSRAVMSASGWSAERRSVRSNRPWRFSRNTKARRDGWAWWLDVGDAADGRTLSPDRARPRGSPRLWRWRLPRVVARTEGRARSDPGRVRVP